MNNLKNIKLTEEEIEMLRYALFCKINKNLDYIGDVPEKSKHLYTDYIKSYEEENEKMSKIIDKLYRQQ